MIEWRTETERKAFGNIDNNTEGEGIWVTDADKRKLYSSWGVVKANLIIPFRKKFNLNGVGPAVMPHIALRQQLSNKLLTKSPNLGQSAKQNLNPFDTCFLTKSKLLNLSRVWSLEFKSKLTTINALAPFIKQLDLSNNDLTEICPEIYTIQLLEALTLDDNHIVDIGSSLTLPNLKFLSLMRNNIRNIPYTLPKQFPNLVNLNLTKNEIGYFPPAENPSASQRLPSEADKKNILHWYKRLGTIVLDFNPLMKPPIHAVSNIQSMISWFETENQPEQKQKTRYDQSGTQRKKKKRQGTGEALDASTSFVERPDEPTSIDFYLGAVDEFDWDEEEEEEEEATPKETTISKSRSSLMSASSTDQLGSSVAALIESRGLSSNSTGRSNTWVSSGTHSTPNNINTSASSTASPASSELLIRPNSDWVIESDQKPKNPKEPGRVDASKNNFYYSKKFRNQVHANCVGFYTPPDDDRTKKSKKESGKIGLNTKFVVLSICKKADPQTNTYEVMIRSREEDKLVRVPKESIKLAKSQEYASTQSILDYISKNSFRECSANLNDLLHNAKIRIIRHEKSHIEFRNLELSLKLPTLNRCGVLYAKPGQMKEEDMYSNTDVPKELYAFLDWLTCSEKITLAKHKGHTAGLDCSGNDATGVYSYYAKFNSLGEVTTTNNSNPLFNSTAAPTNEEFQLMFHVSTLLPFQLQDPERIERKRHIGNDVVVIVWIDTAPGETPPPIPMAFASRMTHVYIVIHRIWDEKDEKKVRYKINVAYKQGVKPVPAEPLFGGIIEKTEEDRRKLLCKLVNCERASYDGFELARTIRTRRHMLMSVIEDKFPAVKTKKTKESAEKLNFYMKQDLDDEDVDDAWNKVAKSPNIHMTSRNAK